MLISLPKYVLFPHFLVKLVCPCVFIALVFHFVSCCTCMVVSRFLLMVLFLCPWSSLLFVLCFISLKTLLIDHCIRLLSPAALQKLGKSFGSLGFSSSGSVLQCESLLVHLFLFFLHEPNVLINLIIAMVQYFFSFFFLFFVFFILENIVTCGRQWLSGSCGLSTNRKIGDSILGST